MPIVTVPDMVTMGIADHLPCNYSILWRQSRKAAKARPQIAAAGHSR